MGTIANLPTDLGRDRLIDTEQTAEFLGMSIPHLRRLSREGRVPAPIKIGLRKNGWRLGGLIDFVAAKSGQAA
jgi:predicted DNA-binding transcriptional regulator AlpA